MLRPPPILLALIAMLCLAPAAAENVAVTGADGAEGTAGASGDPAEPGTPGGDGESVEAVADAVGEDNFATSVGGDGGGGGDGGAASPPSGQGGDGGDGGAGGHATARAIAMDAALAEAVAESGDGAFGGDGGSANEEDGGVDGTSGHRGAAGDARAEASAIGSGPVSAESTAVGAGFGSGGGNASALATAASSAGDASGGAFARSGSLFPLGVDPAVQGDTDATAQVVAAGNATASAAASSDGSGGEAFASARAVSEGVGAVEASSIAIASGAAEGGAAAEAFGSNAGAAAVHVRAEALSTPRGQTGDLTARAEGHSTGGGDVTVEAFASRAFTDLVDPAETALHDAVSGSTRGLLTLRQRINFAGGLVEGDASSSLTATNPGGGALALSVQLLGGVGADAIVGDVIGTSTTGSDVAVDVFAQAGHLGGSVLHDASHRIHGESNGGAVTTRAAFGASQGTSGAIDGGSMEMVDVASGDTTGALALEQYARAGPGGSTLFESGSGGDATSVLTKDTASASLSLFSRATGGEGGAPGLFGAPSRTDGGDAETHVGGSNSAGEARVGNVTTGGDGGTGVGGDAFVEAFASTTGDGHAVVVGEALPTTPVMGPVGAIGGRGGVVGDGRVSGTGQDGGDASSRSVGIAEGDGTVEVHDGATGGAAFVGGSRRGDLAVGSGGVGGDATSTAWAFGAGTSAVLAKAEARGGRAGVGFTTPGAGGDASATAGARGLGEVTAWALATGGDASHVQLAGAGGFATAYASADGANGFARAEARTGAGQHPVLRAQSQAQVASRRDTWAKAARGAALGDLDLAGDLGLPGDPDPPVLHGGVLLTGDPLGDDVDAALGDNTALAALVAEDATADVLALGRWQGTGDGEDPLVLSTELEVELAGDPASRGLVLAAFGTSVLGDGFESLSFSLEKNGELLGESHLFDTTEAFLAFFADALFDLGPGWEGGDTLLARFDLTVSGETRVGMGLAFVQAVPEPGTALLVAFGLFVLARRRSGRRA